MGYNSRMWQKTEGGSGGGRGHSNMVHREKTLHVKDGARRARRHQDHRAVEEELIELQSAYPGLSDAAIREILKASDRDIDV